MDLIRALQGSKPGSISSSRELNPSERQQRGIDPRDPNKYAVTPDGQMISTLIGWSKEPMDPSAISGIVSQGNKPPLGSGPMGLVSDAVSRQMGNQIPRANKNGLTRLSPGVYRNKSGKLVNRMKG